MTQTDPIIVTVYTSGFFNRLFARLFGKKHIGIDYDSKKNIKCISTYYTWRNNIYITSIKYKGEELIK